MVYKALHSLLSLLPVCSLPLFPQLFCFIPMSGILFPQLFCMIFFLISFRSLCKCHLSRETFPDSPTNLPMFYFPPPHTLYLTDLCIYLFICLDHFNSLPRGPVASALAPLPNKSLFQQVVCWKCKCSPTLNPHSSSGVHLLATPAFPVHPQLFMCIRLHDKVQVSVLGRTFLGC